MEWYEVITAVLAILALLVSVYSVHLSRSVAQREREKELRKLHLFVEYMFRIGAYRLIIVNVGYRPVTITGIDLNYIADPEGNRYIDSIPADYIFHPTVEDPFPLTLTDGASVGLRFNDFMTPEWVEKTPGLKIRVYDAERNRYALDNIEPYNFELGNDPGV